MKRLVRLVTVTIAAFLITAPVPAFARPGERGVTW